MEGGCPECELVMDRDINAAINIRDENEKPHFKAAGLSGGEYHKTNTFGGKI